MWVASKTATFLSRRPVWIRGAQAAAYRHHAGNPELALRTVMLPNNGVGLARMEDPMLGFRCASRYAHHVPRLVGSQINLCLRRHGRAKNGSSSQMPPGIDPGCGAIRSTVHRRS